MAALATFERDLISERTKAGLAAARARGRSGEESQNVLEGRFGSREGAPNTSSLVRSSISRNDWTRRMQPAKPGLDHTENGETEQPQRDSNPCRHLERAARSVHPVRPRDVHPVQGFVLVQTALSVKQSFAE